MPPIQSTLQPQKMRSIIIVAFASFSIVVGQSVLYTASATINEYQERHADAICDANPQECGQ